MATSSSALGTASVARRIGFQADHALRLVGQQGGDVAGGGAHLQGHFGVHGEAVREAADAVEGLFLIRAGTLDEARAIVATCPHVLRGGRVELRRIDGP